MIFSEFSSEFFSEFFLKKSHLGFRKSYFILKKKSEKKSEKIDRGTLTWKNLLGGPKNDNKKASGYMVYIIEKKNPLVGRGAWTHEITLEEDLFSKMHVPYNEPVLFDIWNKKL